MTFATSQGEGKGPSQLFEAEVSVETTEKTQAPAVAIGKGEMGDLRESRAVEDSVRTPENDTSRTGNADKEDRDSQGTNFAGDSFLAMSPIIPRKKHGENAETLVLDSPFNVIGLATPCATDPTSTERQSESPTKQSATSPSLAEDNQAMTDGDDNNNAPANEESEGGEEEEEEEETPEERQRREEEESEALARQLMAEEAVSSYNMSTNFLRDNANEYSEEDLAALEAAMAEEDPMANVEEDGDEGDISGELSYDTMLRLGERIGDVKQERWQMVAEDHIAKLPTMKFVPSMALGKDENDSAVKCLVCQCPYETDENLRGLPCGHCFHIDCVDQWLSSKDVCPYCRQSIVNEKK